MTALSSPILLAHPEATATAARDLAVKLEPGDVILLAGDVGAGKTHFARALIQSVLAQPEDVPSPTFTLVQTYETSRGPIWHADLYRLGSSLEIEELGLLEAFETAICLIEWPDRLGTLRPPGALTLTFNQRQDAETARQLNISSPVETWHNRLRGWPA